MANVHTPPLPDARVSQTPGGEPRALASGGYYRRNQRGQATVEYAITFAALIMPLTGMIIFTAQLLWIWHSVVDFTRDGARYATTHCWNS
jgi:hypothetical protein